MDFRDILVHIDNSPQCAARLALAIMLAKEHEGHLTGLYVITHDYNEPAGESLSLKVQEAKEMFRGLTTGAGIGAEWFPVDWAVIGNNMVEILNYYAHTKDLVIIGQTDPTVMGNGIPPDLPERVVLGSGRPVLVVPYAGAFNTVGEKIIVAWREGQASARAVNDAMPFLLTAKKVSVLSIRSASDPAAAVIQPSADICAHLEQYHNIRVNKEDLVTGEIPVANILMNYAWENGCDLIVMGVYAKTSRGTVRLGPVASHILKHMTLPVLMSH
jgi:nucleotide-binding universal stress UspA family protein